ncbi:interferon-inducible GTPase-domain-containing protein [Lanmaoa asiatica]|nr:interferon-inducible GTPase-domain-containing protein [Lanmaoa asiatica]
MEVVYIGYTLISILANVILARGRRPMTPNPSLVDIQDRYHAQEAQRKAEQAVREATAVVERARREAEEEREHARARQEEADRAAERAAEVSRRMFVQMEAVERAARLAQELAESAANATKEEVDRLLREARDEKERARRMREDTERAASSAREDAERAQRAAADERIKAEAGRALAEEAARAAMEERRKALEAKEDAERRLKEGIQPVVTPSPEEFAAAKERIQYKEDYFHFAIAGISGSGKSSLVNAFRGLRSEDTGAAAVGIIETTPQVTRYPEASPEIPFVWYDVPGAGTLQCRDWQYFNNQGLYVFDSIIVLLDNRFTMTDIAILANARLFNIPTYIVRSKADQHIRNLMVEMGYDSEADEGFKRRDELYKAARRQFIEETRNTVKANLVDANLPDQRVYIVSNTSLLGLVKQKMLKKTIDEVELLNDLYSQAHERRCVRSDERVHTENLVG